jgi:hypothetical protein
MQFPGLLSRRDPACHCPLSLLGGIDLLTGKVHACVENRHRSREFIGFLKKLDAAYPTDTAIKAASRQPLRAYLQGNQQVACRPARGPLYLRVYPKTRFLAQSCGRLLLQDGSIRAAAPVFWTVG